jgi:hypothetical protein
MVKTKGLGPRRGPHARAERLNCEPPRAGAPRSPQAAARHWQRGRCPTSHCAVGCGTACSCPAARRGRAPSAGRGRPKPQRRRTLPPAGWPPRQRQRPGPQRRPGCFRQPSGDSASRRRPGRRRGPRGRAARHCQRPNWSGRGDLSEEGPLRLDSTTLTIRVNCRVRHPRPCTSAALAVLASVRTGTSKFAWFKCRPSACS